jgi:hypothetical protein
MALEQNTGERVIDGQRKPIPGSYEQLSVAASAVPPTTVPATATAVLITVESYAIRWTDDGTTPTSSLGNPLDAGDKWFYTGDPSKLQFIRQTSTAKVNLNYYC